MVCHFQDVPVRAASNTMLDNEEFPCACKGLTHCYSWELLQAWPHIFLIHNCLILEACLPMALSRECGNIAQDWLRRSKRQLCFYILFFGLSGPPPHPPFSLRSRLSIAAWLPHVIGQDLNLQNSLKAKFFFFFNSEARISGPNWNMSLVMPGLNLPLSSILCVF